MTFLPEIMKIIGYFKQYYAGHAQLAQTCADCSTSPREAAPVGFLNLDRRELIVDTYLGSQESGGQDSLAFQCPVLEILKESSKL